MRIIKLVLIILAMNQFITAQENPDTSYWSHSGKVALNFSQVGLSNWTVGGDPSMSFNGIFNYTFKFEKDPHLWQNMLDAGFGAQRIGGKEEPFKKSDDKFVFISRYGYKIKGKCYASALCLISVPSSTRAIPTTMIQAFISQTLWLLPIGNSVSGLLIVINSPKKSHFLLPSPH
jgi:hypothetical protein